MQKCANDPANAKSKIHGHAPERLAEFYKRMGGQDGGQHDIPADAEISAPLLQRILESRFHFGTPLEPPGFQHDVQREGGVEFAQEAFDCVIKGLVSVSGDPLFVTPVTNRVVDRLTQH